MPRLSPVAAFLFGAGFASCTPGVLVSPSSGSIPIACRPLALTDSERSTSAKLRAEVAGAVTASAELADGYRFNLRPDAVVFAHAAEWIALERRCCPFLSFDLAWTPGDDAAPTITLTGPEGTKGFLAEELPELPQK